MDLLLDGTLDGGRVGTGYDFHAFVVSGCRNRSALCRLSRTCLDRSREQCDCGVRSETELKVLVCMYM